jgi:hypothetical protein
MHKMKVVMVVLVIVVMGLDFKQFARQLDNQITAV